MLVNTLWVRCHCAVLLSGHFPLVCSGSRVAAFSSFPFLRARKKKSEYGCVDTERYASLVRAAVSTRISSQTPESIEKEDRWLYGSIIRSKAEASKMVKNPYPLLNDAKGVVQSDCEGRPMSKIPLQRDASQPAIASVTKILQKTMSAKQAFCLERWRRKKIAELGEEGFKEYTTKLFMQGKLFHSAIEGILTQENSPKDDMECCEEVDGYLQSVGHVLDDVTGARAIESAVHHEALQYLGVVDCVALYKGSLCVIDWKTSEKPKPFIHNTFDNPLQVAAYIGALNSDKNYNYQVESGLIVVAYKDGTQAHSHWLSAEHVQQYWERWLLRLEEYMEKAA
ncbi:mitochondrial genome maintenance exonuclease 1 [Electrophorus electricus]|uniref:Mitochondrial genome maintenance exonuclease 1 n=1 Tax=Electrophorus electricus TaxID=8005 RepID=A0A4W4H772_ELEEL|nr:mitochondrial genome maintenance exonuclease 1 [Electrophorus electricus]XP_035387386.1 mitochondrial genome maintenance exonuclease 1 [Electrophorus electricus]